MHGIHHSTPPDEHNTNYELFSSRWDRLFHSYTHLDMEINAL